MVDFADALLSLYQDPTLFIVLGLVIVILCVGYMATKRQIVKWLRGRWW